MSIAKRCVTTLLSVILMTALFCAAIPGDASAAWLKGRITKFERTGEIFNETALTGTEEADLPLPESIRAEIELSDKEKKAEFKQAKPKRDGSDGYYAHGYIAPQNASKLYKKGELVIYTFTDADGEESYRVYGSLDGGENKWYASDKKGKITGSIADIAVKWSCDGYDKTKVGDYSFAAVFANYTYALAHPFGVLHVIEAPDSDAQDPTAQEVPAPDYKPGSADCSCGIDSDSEAYEHLESCEKFASACTCPGGEHNPNNMSCPLYAPKAASEGSNGSDMLQYIQKKSLTAGSEPYISSAYSVIIPSAKVDMLNARFMNETMNSFSWQDANGAPVWSGALANSTSGTPADNALRIPSHTDGVWTVYSGEQLAYALTHCVSGQSVKLAGDIDLNGRTQNWGAIGAGNKAITLLGEGHTIYNLGSFDKSGGLGGFIVNGGYLTIKDVSFVGATVVTARSAGLFSSVGGEVTLENVSVKNSLFYSAGDVASPMGSFYGSVKAQGCSVESSAVYGGDYISGFSHVLGTLGGEVSNCWSSSVTLYARGSRTAGFTAGQSSALSLSSCFANNDIEAYSKVAGFAFAKDIKAESCFASGSASEADGLAGFVMYTAGGSGGFTNCFTTLLAESEGGGNQGGFACADDENITASFTNCYSAGSVGFAKMDMSAPTDIGGFVNSAANFAQATFTNCYYDMYATGMRSWAAGDSETIDGITAAAAYSASDGVKSMATGEDIGLGDAYVFEADSYPSLKAFAENEIAADAVKPVKYEHFGVDRRRDFEDADKGALRIMRIGLELTGYSRYCDMNSLDV